LSGFTGSQKRTISSKQVIVTTKLKNVLQPDIQRVEKEAKKALASVCPILGIKYNDPIKIRIVKEAISSSIGGVITLDINRIKAKKAPIVHEVTHIIAEHDDNRFFAEGLAIYFQERFGEDDHGQFSTKHRSLYDWVKAYKDRLMPLKYLSNNNDIFRQLGTEKRKIAYLEAGSFFSFLVEKYGERKLRDLHNASTLNYKKIYGRSLKELEFQWKMHILGTVKLQTR
jgi:hypothetical protein